MSPDTFSRLIPLMRLVGDGEFFISCLHEPTLHPGFLDLIDLIPVELRKKSFFTTNLARKLDDVFFERLATCGIHHINVSFDTMNEELFSVLRKGGKYDIFIKNLEKLSSSFGKTKHSPPIHYITMAYKSNKQEIPEIIKTTKERYLSAFNEIRHTFNVKHISDEFRKFHFLDKGDWDSLAENLSGIDGCVTSPPPSYNYNEYAASIDYYEKDDEQHFAHPAAPPPYPLNLRVSWDGSIRIIGWEKHFYVNINFLRDPVDFFLSL